MEVSPNVFVSGYDHLVTKELMWKHFEDCGTIYKVDMMESAGSGRFSFVEFTDAAAGRAAVANKDRSILGGRSLRVRYANRKTNTPHSSPPPLPPLPPTIPIALSPPPPPPLATSHPPTKTTTPMPTEPLGPSDPTSHWLFASTTTLLTPSYLAGISFDVETQLRRTTSWYIIDLQRKLDLPRVASLSAMTYMNRFFMLHSFSSHDRFLVASAAIFLSAKVNERTVKLTHVADASLKLATDAENASSTITLPADMDFVKSRIRQYEVILLNSLSYDVVVPQPHLALAALADRAIAQVDMARENVLAVADVFLTDAIAGIFPHCFRIPRNGWTVGTLALQLTSDELAAGALYLSCRFHRY
ncbi:hypothetical protein DYB37_004103 [Aphanomyces astaci]|uniref:RRM domain-containing protein n=1 Tax=Aphanomyces astaci TaxID=112090 RepID=A0A3R6XRX1_APHAT|nr:hypothetical protein DYB35_010238 [Aphanomyces astaci]RHZ21220.1 hypothetical protein DYB37_004103 [Aphanomyces astaci]